MAATTHASARSAGSPLPLVAGALALILALAIVVAIALTAAPAARPASVSITGASTPMTFALRRHHAREYANDVQISASQLRAQASRDRRGP